MPDLEDKELLQAIIARLYQYSITGTELKIFISSKFNSTREFKNHYTHYRIVICPYKDGYRGKTPDIAKMLILHSNIAPFIGTRDMKPHEVMPIVHRVLTGEIKEGADGEWLERQTDQ